jgi:hypothetical protein
MSPATAPRFRSPPHTPAQAIDTKGAVFGAAAPPRRHTASWDGCRVITTPPAFGITYRVHANEPDGLTRDSGVQLHIVHIFSVASSLRHLGGRHVNKTHAGSVPKQRGWSKFWILLQSFARGTCCWLDPSRSLPTLRRRRTKQVASVGTRDEPTANADVDVVHDAQVRCVLASGRGSRSGRVSASRCDGGSAQRVA